MGAFFNTSLAFFLTSFLIFSVTSCAQGIDDQVVIANCPKLAVYSQDDLNKAADELDSLPGGSILPEFMKNYQVLRAQARACHESKKP